ncbi:MAG: putative sulfate exporter family transporter, partial [Acetobacteraceae bacterium]
MDTTQKLLPSTPTMMAALISFAERLRGLAPGLAAACAIALTATGLRSATGIAALNPVVLALALGMVVRAILGASPTLRPGIAFAVQPLLRAAIILLGLGVTLGQLRDLGIGALALAVAVVASTLPFT